MKTKQTLTKNLFETTYVAKDSNEIKSLKSAGVLTKDDVVKVDKSTTAAVLQEDDVVPAVSGEETTEEPKIEMYAEYLSNMKGEKPFEIHGDKYEYVWGMYPDGKRDIAVYKFAGDYTLSFAWFKKFVLKQVDETDGVNEGVSDGLNDGVNEGDDNGQTNITKLKQDVSKLVAKIETILGPYLEKIDKPLEQAEFIAAMAEKVGVPRNKLTSIISHLKDLAIPTAEPTAAPTQTNESVRPKISKASLIENVIKSTEPKVITRIKIKDIK